MAKEKKSDKYIVDDLVRSDGFKEFMKELREGVIEASLRVMARRTDDISPEQLFLEKAKIEGQETLLNRIAHRVQEAQK